MANKEVIAEEKPSPEKEISVLLDESGNPIQKEEKKQENVYVRPEDLEPIRKGQNFSNAAIRKMQEDLARISERLTPKEAPKPETPPDEWDTKLQKDWKGTVAELAEKRYQELREKEKAEERAISERQKNANLLESNKRKVIERHPELSDDTSVKAEIFKQVMEENPDYLSDPFGPILTMRDMEDRLREKGIYDEPTKKVVEKEANRLARTSGGGVKTSVASPTNRIVLSKDEKELCDLRGIKYETYAKMKQAGNTGVEA